MPNLLRNVLAVIAGIVVGSCVNIALIAAGSAVVSQPHGMDMSNAESRHFVMPFLAHALGTSAGALAAYLIAASYKLRFALAIGVIFLCGGIAASFMIPAPAWFIALDLLVAYIPMAWLAGRVGARMASARPGE